MVKAHLDAQALSQQASVDPKTVQRWLGGRIPYARHRWAVSKLVNEDERYLWPEASTTARARVCGGRLATSTESKEVGWVPLDQLDAFPMHESTRLRIRHHLDQRALPYIG
jgi:hypothetical protein